MVALSAPALIRQNQPPSTHGAGIFSEAKAEKYFDKQKFNRALKGFNRAIKDNKYDFELFELRSKTKEKLGDIHGARIDNLNSIILKGKIISIVNVIGLSYTTSGVRQFRIVHRRIDY